MDTEERAAVNRANSEHSTGPVTEEGRMRSSQNALKHGLTASLHVVMDGEDEEEFIALEQRLMNALEPWDDLEAELARAIASLTWRLKRVPTIERGVLAWAERHERREQLLRDYRRLFRPDRKREARARKARS